MTHPLVAQVPTGLVAGRVRGRDLEHLATFPDLWLNPRAFCAGQELVEWTEEWTINAAATGVNPRRVCRRCVALARARDLRIQEMAGDA